MIFGCPSAAIRTNYNSLATSIYSWLCRINIVFFVSYLFAIGCFFGKNLELPFPSFINLPFPLYPRGGEPFTIPFDDLIPKWNYRVVPQ